MDVTTAKALLAGLPIPQVQYYDTIGSTNDEALHWAASGAEDGCLVVADQQTLGRGRFGRRWVTQPGAALAFSLILHPTSKEVEQLGFFSPLGALAICQALEEAYGLAPQIKWPNDVLLRRRKAAGILVEAAWVGDQIQGVIIGIGLNVVPQAVPPADQLLFPATSVEQELAAGQSVDRLALLRLILQRLFEWRVLLNQKAFFQEWEARLAFRGEWVRIEEGSAPAGGEAVTGQITGLDPAGNLLLHAASGQDVHVAVGDVHLRLME